MYAFTADPRTRLEAETILRNMELGFGMAGTGVSKAKTKSVSVDDEQNLAAKVAQMVLESLGQNKPQNNNNRPGRNRGKGKGKNPDWNCEKNGKGGNKCHNCGKTGHFKKDCWAKGEGKEGQGPKRNWNKPKAQVNQIEVEEESKDEDIIIINAIGAKDKPKGYNVAKDMWFTRSE